jgi:hypothetical protein
MERSRSSRAQRLAERRRERERLAQVQAALADEVSRFNQAVSAGAEVVLNTAFGPYVVGYASRDLDITCYPAGRPRDSWHQRTFMLANDGRWSDLLRQAGVERHPLFQ